MGNFGVERESGISLRNLFRPIAAGRVQYIDLAHDLATGPLPSGDPFRKGTRYRSQSEYRFVLIPLKPISADFIWVDCPQARGLLQAASIQRDQEKISDGAVRPKEDENHERVLTLLIEKWQRLQSELSVRDALEREAFWKSHNSTIDAETSRATIEASHAGRIAAQAEFDRMHLKELRKCLFVLRKPPFNDSLDRALARGASSERLISAFERPLWTDTH